MTRLSQVAVALDAQLIGPDVAFLNANTDSRKIQAGDLFIALRGEKFDGAEYVAASLKAGAIAALFNRESYVALRAELPADASLLLVADTRIALGKLAAFWRAQFDIPLVAITGSNGKTTVKEMLAAILREHAGDTVLATQGNFN
ncbi:MAG: Mur ligase domain-containing protein, partial [Gallionella sp.]